MLYKYRAFPVWCVPGSFSTGQAEMPAFFIFIKQELLGYGLSVGKISNQTVRCAVHRRNDFKEMDRRCRKSVNSSGSRFTCITVIATLLIFMGSVFRQIRENPDVFRSLKVDEKMGTIYWDNGADIDPDVLYLRLTPAWMESEANESKAA